MMRCKLHYLFAFSLFISAICCSPTQAMGVNFDLEIQTDLKTPADDDVANHIFEQTPSTTASLTAQDTFRPLPVPATAVRHAAGTKQSSSSALPDNIIASTRVLTPPPLDALPTSRIIPPTQNPPKDNAIALSFISEKSDSLASTPKPAVTARANPVMSDWTLPDWIYAGESDSLVARVIGSAEGTRTASGRPTQAYYGHTDPGNGVWNMGTFSYQHGARSPQEADKKQLKRLKKQGKTIASQAKQADLTMTLGEVLNGLDLANQSPKAALEKGGYIDRLAQARQQGMKNSDAIVWARTYSYIDPNTQRWNAPGLGNTLSSIQRDQNRRHNAVAQAFNHYQAQKNTTETLAAEVLTMPEIASSQQPLDTALDESPQLSNPAQSIQLAFSVTAASKPVKHDDLAEEQQPISTLLTIPETSPTAASEPTNATPQAHYGAEVESAKIPG